MIRVKCDGGFDDVSTRIFKRDPDFPEFTKDQNGNDVIIVNPWKLVSHILQKYEGNVPLLEYAPAPLLPLNYIMALPDIVSTKEDLKLRLGLLAPRCSFSVSLAGQRPRKCGRLENRATEGAVRRVLWVSRVVTSMPVLWMRER
jgi:hypothetical protein